MTKKHYIEIAKMISETKDAKMREQLAEWFAKWFAKFSKTFDREKFMVACLADNRYERCYCDKEKLCNPHNKFDHIEYQESEENRYRKD